MPDFYDTGLVLILTLFMAAASGLGAVPYFFVRSFSKEYSALASAVACGVMLAASFDLVHEGQPYGANLVILGVLFGKSMHSTSLLHCCVYQRYDFTKWNLCLVSAEGHKVCCVHSLSLHAHIHGEYPITGFHSLMH